jgi:hypothetical protein
MICENTTCAIFIVCQNKDQPCPGNTSRTLGIHSGYAAMAAQEQRMRMCAIDYNGDWSIP